MFEELRGKKPKDMPCLRQRTDIRNGKKFLVLGSYYNDGIIVQKAQELGYYTIVTDNHHSEEHTPAKHVADEYWDISWTDIDALEKKCREAGVTGILGGFSERRVESMIRLCARLGLPCSITMEQLEVTRDKLKFKQACRRSGLPCVKEYQYDDEMRFPVIVKPTDRAGSIGINVAYNRAQFEKDYAYAMSLSESKHVIVEEFIDDGVKFDIYYYVQNGGIVFLGSSDTIMCKGKDGAEILQKAWPFPSRHEQQFLKEEDEHVRTMIRQLGIDNCYLTMSAFYRNGEFYFFEAGFRLSGEMSFNYYKAVSGIDYVDVMIRFALGEKEHVKLREVREHEIKSLILNFYGRNGVVGRICGEEEVKALPGVVDFLVYLTEGETIHNETKVLRKIGMCTICSDDMNVVKDTARKVNQLFLVTDKDGKDLIYERMSAEELEDYEVN